MKKITAFAPATIGNVSVGYDVLGLSVNNIGDEVELTVNGGIENRITEIVNGENLPTEIEKNCCSVVIRKMQESLQEFTGVDIRITKGFASGSGMGSSSASSAAAAYAYNELKGRPFSNKELVFFAAEGERVASGSAHTDNVASSILGGIVLSNGKTIKDIIELPVPENLFVVSLLPKIEIKTSDSRKILKRNVPLSIASKQVGLMAAFVSSLYEGDLDLLSHSLRDLFAEPTRQLLIPLFAEMKKAVIDNGGMAFGISGSGPAVFALCHGEKNAKAIKTALATVYNQVDIDTTIYINALVKDSGARIIE